MSSWKTCDISSPYCQCVAWQDDHDCEMDAIDIVDHDLFEETDKSIEAGEVHRLDLKPLGSRKMLQVTPIPSISIHLQHSTNSVAQRVGSIFVGCFAG